MINLLSSPIFQLFISIGLPVLILPFLMRFLIGRLVLWRVKKKYFPQYLKRLYSGWTNEQDRCAIDSVKKLAFQKIRYHFIFKPELLNDIKAVLLCIKNTYNPETNKDKLNFSFSIIKLIECSLLAFSDLYTEYAEKSWFKMIQNIKLIWFYRVWNFKKYYQMFFSLPIMDKLRKARLFGKVIRVLLIPLIGFPSILWYVIRSILISIFLEGFFRFFYALLLMKVGYYSLYLYGRNNNIIGKRIKNIPRKKLGELNKKMQAIILPDKQIKKSSRYQKAVDTYMAFLKEFEITPDKVFINKKEQFKQKTKKIFNMVSTAIKRAYIKRNPFRKNKTGEKEKLLRFYLEIGKIYAPRAKEPFKYLRLRELLSCGYMASVIILHKVLYSPGLKPLLSKVSGDFSITLLNIVKDEKVKLGAKGVKKAYNLFSIYRMGSRAFRVLRGIVAPYTLIWTFGSPVLFQQFQDILKEYVSHRIGRLMLFTWESNMLKRKNDLKPLLW